jgi:hypothetical protein
VQQGLSSPAIFVARFFKSPMNDLENRSTKLLAYLGQSVLDIEVCGIGTLILV